MLPSPNPEMSAVPSISAGHGLDLLAVVAHHDVIAFIERVVVRVGERLRVMIDEPPVIFDAEEAVANRGAPRRAALLQRDCPPLPPSRGVGCGDRPAAVARTLAARISPP